MVDPHGVGDVGAADGAAVVARLEHLAALVARDHVVAGVEETVAHARHADGAVPIHVRRQDGCTHTCKKRALTVAQQTTAESE